MKKVPNSVSSKQIFLLFSPVVLVWIALVCWIASSPALKITSGKQSFYFSAFSDSIFSGHSESKARLSGDTLFFEYRLKKGYSWPYAGLNFTPPPGSINGLQRYNCLRLHLKAMKAKVIPVIINEYVPGYSDTVSRDWIYNLKLLRGENEYKISFSDFKPPLQRDTLSKTFSGINPEMIRSISIHNCVMAVTDIRDEIKIYDMSIEMNYAACISGVFVFTVSWILASILFIVLKRNKASVFIPYIATEVKSCPENEWEKVQNFISIRYVEALDMDTMEKELGIARHKIASIIKENTSLIFKQYLNQIRIAEATRLLSETNLPVAEVADKVGFGHISNFNRVFKEYARQSPSDLRRNFTP